ncbi:MAG TPA: MAPEG family protein [Polyangiaceae bacterium]|nr:MAPEG family protein [Polyangiaceae bacterium]
MTSTADAPPPEPLDAAKSAGSSEPRERTTHPTTPNLLPTFARVSVVIGAFAAFVAALVSHDAAATAAPDPKALVQPIVALAALTGLVLIGTAVARNAAVLVGKVSMRYYRTYAAGAPPEWIERPARTYMNLLELPVLFYVVCILMIATGRVDTAQVELAWLFVATRVVHAAIYLAVNHVPSRFASFVTGAITLTVLWTRFAMMG